MSNLTRGCFGLVIRNKGESNLTHCCSILQDQNNHVLNKIPINEFHLTTNPISNQGLFSVGQLVVKRSLNGCQVDFNWILLGCPVDIKWMSI